MISFVCPGCISTHSANEAFAGLRARCVVCGAGIVIPKTGGVTASCSEPTGSTRSSRTRNGVSRAAKPAIHSTKSARPVAVDETEDEDRGDDELTLNESTSENEEHVSELNDFDYTTSKEDLLAFNKLDGRKLLRKEGQEEEQEQQQEEEQEQQQEEEQEQQQDQLESDAKGEEGESPKETRKKGKKKRRSAETIEDARTDDPDALRDTEERRKSQIKTGIALAVTVVCVSIAVYVAFFRGESAPKFEPPAPAKPTPAKPVVQAPKEEPVPPPPPQIAPMPRPHRPTNGFLAATFFLQRKLDPLAFDQQFGGTYLVIHGFARRHNGAILLTENPKDVEGLVCVPVKVPVHELRFDPSEVPISPGTTLFRFVAYSRRLNESGLPNYDLARRCWSAVAVREGLAAPLVSTTVRLSIMLPGQPVRTFSTFRASGSSLHSKWTSCLYLGRLRMPKSSRSRWINWLMRTLPT
jgi:hypothetical protein